MHTSLVVFSFFLFLVLRVATVRKDGAQREGGPKGSGPKIPLRKVAQRTAVHGGAVHRGGGCMPMNPLANPGHIPCQLCSSIGGTLTRRTLRMKLRRLHCLELTVWRFAVWRFGGLVVWWSSGLCGFSGLEVRWFQRFRGLAVKKVKKPHYLRPRWKVEHQRLVWDFPRSAGLGGFRNVQHVVLPPEVSCGMLRRRCPEVVYQCVLSVSLRDHFRLGLCFTADECKSLG